MAGASSDANHEIFPIGKDVVTPQRDKSATLAVNITTEPEQYTLLGASQVETTSIFLCNLETLNERLNANENCLHSAKCREDKEMTATCESIKAGYTAINEDECRICQSGGEESLISPCKCSGSAKWVHQTCLVKWFQISHTSSCELCAYQVIIKKTTKPISEWRFPRGNLGPCSRVDLWYLFVTVFSVSTVLGFCIFQLLVKSKELETKVVFGAIYVLCGVMIILRIRYFYQWFTRRSAFWRKWKTLNQIWTVVSPGKEITSVV